MSITHDRDINRPERIDSGARNRARVAAVKAIRSYPGPVGEVLADAIRAYEDLGWLAQPSCAVRRLIDQLLA